MRKEPHGTIADNEVLGGTLIPQRVLLAPNTYLIDKTEISIHLNEVKLLSGT